MLGIGGIELLLILGLLSGGTHSDLVSMIPVKEYFKVRDIDPTVDRLVELASQAPDTPKTQVRQLLALRQLAADIDRVKSSAKAADHRKLLEQIAQGRTAADSADFASKYAKLVLLAWDGGKELSTEKANWAASLSGLPEKSTFIGLADLRGVLPIKGQDLTSLFLVLPKEEKEAIFTNIEKIGNVQVEQFAFALVDPPGDNEPMELYLRVTGKYNPAWMTGMLESVTSRKFTQKKGPSGKAVHVLQTDSNGPAIALIGGTDFLLCGYPPEANRKNGNLKHLEVLDKFLAEIAMPGPGPAKGFLKDDLAKIPTGASLVAVGTLPNEMRNSPFPMPERILVHGARVGGAIDLQCSGAMKDEAAAKNLIRTIGGGRDAGLKEIAMLQGQPLPIPNLNLAPVIAMLESIQLQSNGNLAQLRMVVPEGIFGVIPSFFLARQAGG